MDAQAAWYVVGPLVGLVIVAMLWITKRPLGAQLGGGQLAGLVTGAGLILGVVLRGSNTRLKARSGAMVGS